MKKFLIKVNGKEYEVEVEQIGEAPIQFNPIPAPPQAAPAVPEKEKAAATSNGHIKVTAPMPGTILSVKKKVGDVVSMGETILVLEAMKMENEISAPRDGTLISLHVEAGIAVESGQVLASLA